MASGLRTYHVKKLSVFASPDRPVTLPRVVKKLQRTELSRMDVLERKPDRHSELSARKPGQHGRPSFQNLGAFLMTPFRPLLIAAAAASVLAACSFSPWASNTSVPPSPTSLSLDQPAATAGPAYGVAQETTVETTEEIVLMGPDNAVRIRPSTTSEHYRKDSDSCYAYARGQVAHDARIESDVGAAFQSEAGGLGLAALRGRMSNFERTRRVPSLFRSCMAAKGYGRR